MACDAVPLDFVTYFGNKLPFLFEFMGLSLDLLTVCHFINVKQKQSRNGSKDKLEIRFSL